MPLCEWCLRVELIDTLVHRDQWIVVAVWPRRDADACIECVRSRRALTTRPATMYDGGPL
jgi:hypothetical protein